MKSLIAVCAGLLLCVGTTNALRVMSPKAPAPVAQDSTITGAQEVYLKNWDLSSTANPSVLYPVTVPNTVLGALFSSNAPGFQFDPMYGKNMDMIDKSMFDVPWVFNTTFDVPAAGEFSQVVLHLEGFIYNITVNVNGKDFPDPNLFGGFRRLMLKLSGDKDLVIPGQTNTLRVTVQKPFEKPKEVRDGTGLSISFYDWAPHPADLSMGLWRPVYVSILPPQKPFTMNGLSVKTDVARSEPRTAAHQVITLNASVIVSNWHTEAISTNVWLQFTSPTGAFSTFAVNKTFTIPAMREHRVFFEWTEFPALTFVGYDSQQLLWWPWQMGAANLVTVHGGVGETGGNNLLKKRVGFRSMVSRKTEAGALQVVVNNIPLLIRAGAWCPDLFLRTDNVRLQQQMDLVMGMNLNAIRLEGKGEHEAFFERADEYGLLLLADLGCCEKFPDWTDKEFTVATRAMTEQVRKLQTHPSVAWILASSDFTGPEYVEAKFYEIYKYEAWPNIVVSSASEVASRLHGPTGVKLTGPYSWVPPSYWLADDSPKVANHGGAWGFFTEGGPGEAPMTYDSWNKTIPLQHQWNPTTKSNSSWWNYHMGNPNGLFKSLDMFFSPALIARYGGSNSAQTFLYRSQVANYESIRSMYEGYTRNKHRNATGVVQWMMNNAWPANLWHLFDWHLGSGGGYYGAQKACNELHIMMSPVSGTVTLINSLFDTILSGPNSFSVHAKIVSLSGEIKWHKQIDNIEIVPADASIDLHRLQVPILGGGMFAADETFLVHLEVIVNGTGATAAENWYWQSPTTDVLDFAESNGYRTPTTQFANFNALSNIGTATLSAQASLNNEHTEITVTITNQGPAPSFFTHLAVVDPATGSNWNPQIWTDNYVTLMPGATKSYTAVVKAQNVDLTTARIAIESYNSVVAGNPITPPIPVLLKENKKK